MNAAVFESRLGATALGEVDMQVAYELAPVIAEIISAHCPGTRARDEFMHACVYGQWDDAMEMVKGMLAEPWHLQGYQETRPARVPRTSKAGSRLGCCARRG